MRKNYNFIASLFGTLLFSIAGIAQQSDATILSDESMFSMEGSRELSVDVDAANAQLSSSNNAKGKLAAPGAILFSEDFAGGALPAGWTNRVISGPGTWSWSNNPNGTVGQYGNGNNRITSTTAANGTMIIDCDSMNPGPSTGFVDIDAYIEIPLPNLSAVRTVILEFEHYWRPFADAELLLEVSPDGVTWDTLDMRQGVPSNESSFTTFGITGTSAKTERINLTKEIAGGSAPKVRFHWRGGSHYFWQIDDIKLIEGETNDLRMEEIAFVPLTDSLRVHYGEFYTRIPSVQALQYPITVGAKFCNVGANIQRNAGVTAIASGPSSFSQTITNGSSIVRSKDSDSTSVSSFVLNSGEGDYRIDVITKADSLLKNTGDDTATVNIAVTDTVYARDEGDIASSQAFLFNKSANVYEFDLAVVYEIKTMDTVSSISFVNPATNTTNVNASATIRADIYQFSNYTANGIVGIGAQPIFTSGDMMLSNFNNSPDQWVSLPVSRTGSTMDTIAPGNYFVVFHGNQVFNTDTVLWPVEPGDAQLFQYVIRTNANGTQGNWGLTSRKFMVRLNTKPSICPSLVGASAKGFATTACGNTDGRAEVDTLPINGAAPFNFKWDVKGSIVTGRTINQLSSGSYTVTITDANGCSTTAIAGVSDFGAPTVTLDAANSVTTTTCYGQRQGKIQINVVAGSNPNPNYTYKWTDANNPGFPLTGTTVLSNLEAGSYQVEVNDGSNPPCLQSIKVNITGPDTLVFARSSVDNIDCKGEAVGTITVIGAGGTPATTGAPYSIQWAGGTNTDFNRTGLTGGNYLYTVTDDNGCTFTGNQLVTEPNNFFEITDVELIGGGNTPGASIIDDSKAGEVKLTANASGGTIDVIKWTNPSGKVISGQTGTELIIDPDKKDRDVAGDYIAVATSFDGCTSEEKVFSVESGNGINFTSINEFGNASTLAIYPNPSTDKVNVKIDGIDNGTYTISLNNAVGQVVYSNTVESDGNITNSINVSNFDKGVYFLNISNGTTEVSKRVIVK